MSQVPLLPCEYGRQWQKGKVTIYNLDFRGNFFTKEKEQFPYINTFQLVPGNILI